MSYAPDCADCPTPAECKAANDCQVLRQIRHGQARLADPCLDGHDWDTDGGRACPHEEDCGGSQTVYRCRRCGVHDYGEPGGPAHDDCYLNGPCRGTAIVPTAEERR